MSAHPMQARSVLDASEEKIAVLTQQLDEKEAEIDRLRRELKKLRSSKNESRGDGALSVPSFPVTKLLPTLHTKDMLSDESSDAEDASEQKIADSRFEAMHLYYQGLSLLDSHRYEQAVVPLREFLASNPDHVYADRAEFLIGQAYFLNKEFELAVLSYSRVEAKYPYSVKLAEAIYQRGISYLNMGQSTAARGVFRDLVRRFPKEEWAKKATQRLAEFSVEAPLQFKASEWAGSPGKTN